jgi:hypothetical protein
VLPYLVGVISLIQIVNYLKYIDVMYPRPLHNFFEMINFANVDFTSLSYKPSFTRSLKNSSDLVSITRRTKFEFYNFE